MPKKSLTKPKTGKSSRPKIDSCMQFADCLGLQHAAAKGLNFVFSPMSIRIALRMAAAGSNGSTLDQFLTFLGSRTHDDLNSATEKLMASVRTETGLNPNPAPNECGECGSHLALVNSCITKRMLTFFLEVKKM